MSAPARRRLVGHGGPTAHRRASGATDPQAASRLFADADSTLLDLVDNILTKGVVIDAEIVLGLAGVDLVYVRLSALVSAADKIRRVLAQ